MKVFKYEVKVGEHQGLKMPSGAPPRPLVTLWKPPQVHFTVSPTLITTFFGENVLPTFVTLIVAAWARPANMRDMVW